MPNFRPPCTPFWGSMAQAPDPLPLQRNDELQQEVKSLLSRLETALVSEVRPWH